MPARSTHRRWGFALATGLALWLAGAAAGSAGAETWYAQRFTSGDTPVRVDQLWSKGPRLRSETVIAGRPILTLVAGERYFIVDRLAGTGIAIRRSPAALKADARRGRPFANEVDELLRAGAEKVGRQSLGDRDCDLYRYTGPAGRQEACVSPDAARLPIQVERWVRASGQRALVRYLDWSRGFPVPDGFFEPDPRWQIESIDYDDYRKRSRKEPVGPAPPFFSSLLHGSPDS